MKEIKAFVHRGRAAEIVHGLLEKGFDQISLVDVKGTLEALTERETEYSVEFGRSIITEVKIEVVCADSDVPAILDIFQAHAKSARAPGWVYVSAIELGLRLDLIPRKDSNNGP